MENFFEHYFESNGLHLKYARSAPSVRGQELHDYHEFVFFLGGKVRFTSKTIQQNLKVGNMLIIPKNSFHRFDVIGHDYTRCILGFYANNALQNLLSSVGTEIRLIETPSDAIKSLLDSLLGMAESNLPSEEKSLYLYATVVHLLFECKKNENCAISRSINVSKTVHDALLLIDEKYKEPLTVAKLAALLHVSESLLSHKFKEEMHISVYNYISQKRLSVAKELIASGTPITQATVQSGFSDYSCFLRMYKSRYGSPPSTSKHTPVPDFFRSTE